MRNNVFFQLRLIATTQYITDAWENANLPKELDPVTKDKQVWEIVAWISLALFILVLLLTLVMIRRIRIAVACLKVNRSSWNWIGPLKRWSLFFPERPDVVPLISPGRKPSGRGDAQHTGLPFVALRLRDSAAGLLDLDRRDALHRGRGPEGPEVSGGRV